jgi:2'-5' RNA ligase
MLDSKDEGIVFLRSQWPLHLTIVPPFELTLESSEVARIIELATSQLHPFFAELASYAGFGPRGDIPVRLVQLSPHLDALHRLLRAAVIDAGARFPRHNFPFRPHVATDTNHPLDDAALLVDSCSLVELAPDHNPSLAIVRRVVRLH